MHDLRARLKALLTASVLLAASATTSVSAVSLGDSTITTTRYYGDVNASSAIDVIDALRLKRSLVDSSVPLIGADYTAGDLNADGTAGESDYLTEMQFVLGKLTNFAAGTSFEVTNYRAAQIDTSKTYLIKNLNSGLYLDVADGTAANGTNVQQWGATSAQSNNTWKFVEGSDGYYYIYSLLDGGSTYLLDVDYGESDNGTNIAIYQNTNSDAQLYKLIDCGGSYVISPKVSNDKSAIEIINAETDNGANVQEWEINGHDCQKWVLVDASTVVPPSGGDGQYEVEQLSRGLISAYTSSGMLVSWRALGTDPANATYKLYRNGSLVYTSSGSDATCYKDASGNTSSTYTLESYNGSTLMDTANMTATLKNKSSGQSGAYMDIPISTPNGLTMPDGTTCTYAANDCSVGDVDGDGEYEIFVKWDPSNSQDNSKSGYTGNVYIDCYKLNGTRMWRVDLGINIRAGAHYTQFMVADYDSDGKAEMICKTSDGSVDGTGATIGSSGKDYRASNGYILTGNEYLTLFDGQTGKALDTINYNPPRGNVSDWGDGYGNRVDRFLGAVAYLDGETPSCIMVRGYYTRMTAAAYDVENNKLVEKWFFDTNKSANSGGFGNGNHNCMPADVDGDGKHELVMGACCIDDDGSLLWTNNNKHGDAMHLGDLDPTRAGLELWVCHEGAPYGTSLLDAKTGKTIFRIEASGDTGRCVAGNFISGNSSAEFCSGADGKIYNASGSAIGSFTDITKWGMNSTIYWTDTLERAVLDRAMADQYGKGRVFTGEGSYNNGSKSNAGLTCDLFGDWREEAIFRVDASSVLRVFTTSYTTTYRIPTLMHDVQYRCQVAGQNVAYNQPPHTSFWLGTGSALPEYPDVHTVG